MNKTYRINQAGKLEQKRVLIGDFDWQIKMPGAKTEFALSKAQRVAKVYRARIDQLDGKIESGYFTPEELDKYEDYVEKMNKEEAFSYQVFANMFVDGTEGNAQVEQWLNATSMSEAMDVFNQIKDQEEAGGVEPPEQKATNAQEAEVVEPKQDEAHGSVQEETGQQPTA